MTARERELLGRVLARLLAAIDALDAEPTFRNISFAERNDLFCDIYELRDGKRPAAASGEGPIG